MTPDCILSARHGQRRKSFEQRFWEKVYKTTTCWLWTGCASPLGYGSVRVDGANRRAHRVAYELLVGPVPAGLQLDHLCRVTACVNPAHLEPVTQAENTRRGDTASSINGRKTHCVNGHPFDEVNTSPRLDGKRRCRTCAQASMRAFKARIKADPAARAKVNEYRRGARARKRAQAS